MRTMLLKLATLLLFFGCGQEKGRFDVKSQDFNRKSSHHYSEKFNDVNIESDSVAHKNLINNKDKFQSNELQEEIVDEISNQDGLFSNLFNMFSSDDEKIDSLGRAINECEERLYTSTDQASSKQGAINSLIGERNYLLKQLDSLQTVIVQSKQVSNQKVVRLEREHKRLNSLIEILSSEIE